MEEMRTIFDHFLSEKSASKSLISLCQGTCRDTKVSRGLHYLSLTWRRKLTDFVQDSFMIFTVNAQVAAVVRQIVSTHHWVCCIQPCRRLYFEFPTTDSMLFAIWFSVCLLFWSLSRLDLIYSLPGPWISTPITAHTQTPGDFLSSRIFPSHNKLSCIMSCCWSFVSASWSSS